MEQRLANALLTLQKLLLDASLECKVPISFALIGGLAMSAWGVVRATEDIDLLADSNPSPLKDLTLRSCMRGYLGKRGCKVEWRVGEIDDPIPLLLRVEMPRPTHGLRADILWAHRRWQREALTRAITLEVSGKEVFVVHPEDLILMKLDAGGPQDLLDVEGLLSNPSPEVDVKRLRKKAAQLRLDLDLESRLRQSRRPRKK